MDTESVDSSCSSEAYGVDSPRIFPVADGVLYSQKAEFYRKLQKQRNRRAFSARCSREGKQNPRSNRRSSQEQLCQEHENILTEEDLSRLFCAQRNVGEIVKQRSRTYRNPVCI